MSSRRLLAVLLAVLVVTSVAVASVAGTTAAQSDDGDGDLPEADDAYVTEEGDVVLAYANDSEGTQVDFGLDVSQSVFHALVVTNATNTETTGSATAVLDPDGVAANGSLFAPRPDELSSLTVDVTGARTDEEANLDASLDATLAGEAPATGLVTGAEASGTVEVAPSTFTASGQVDADLRTPLGPPQHQSFSLRETADGYTLDAAQDFTVSEYAADRWNTRSRAKKNLEAQYGALARSLGGTSEVTVESYSFTNTSTGGRLDVEFTVRYEGVDEGLSRTIASTLSDSEQYDLSDAEARQVADAVATVHVDEVSLTFDQRTDAVSASFTAALSDYESAVRAAFTVANSVDTGEDVEVAEQLDRLERTFEARQESGLVERFGVDASVDSPQEAPTTVAASVTYRTENWAAYREALRERGIDPASTEFELHARTEGEEIVAEGSLTVQKDGLLADASNALLNATDEEDTEARRFLRAFQDAELRKARMDVSLADEEVRVEAGAAFRNLTSLRDAIQASTGSDLQIASAVGRTEGGQVETYVTLEGAVGSDASESDVRALGPVGDDTEVHLPGTYDRSFPETNVSQAYEYLGVERTETPGDGGGPLGQPGFGLGAGLAAVALLGAALLAARTRHSS